MAEHKCARCGVADEAVEMITPAVLPAHRTLMHCELAALKRENAALRAREEQVAVAFAAFALNPSAPLYGSDAAYFAAFRKSDAYPK